MKHLACILWFSALVVACGCGGGAPNLAPRVGMPDPKPPDPKPHALDMASNWQFNTTSNVPGAPSLTIAGSLNPAGGAVGGAVHVDGSNCFDRLTTIGLTGSLTGGELSLTSAPVAGQVMTFTGSLGDSAINGTGSAFTGTYTISGGCANGDQGSVSGIKIPFLANVMSGTFTTSAGDTFDVSGDETQSSTPSTEGSFGIQGTITFRTSCFSSGTLTPGTYPSGSFIMGTLVALEIETGNGKVNFLGTLDRDKGEISGNYTASGGTCDQTGTGVLFTLSPWDY